MPASDRLTRVTRPQTRTGLNPGAALGVSTTGPSGVPLARLQLASPNPDGARSPLPLWASTPWVSAPRSGSPAHHRQRCATT